MQLRVSVHRLRSRVLDDQLRAEVGEFASLCALCAASAMSLGQYPQGRIPDDQKDAAIAQLQAQIVRISDTYAQLTELLGVHLRRELDRRFLVAPDREHEHPR